MEPVGPIGRGFDVDGADGANIGGGCLLVDAQGSIAVGSSSSISGEL